MSSTSVLSRAVMKKSSVPKLLELCYKKLISHKHLLYKVGKAPYYLLKRVLRHCTPDELRSLEKANPHLMDEDMELWKDHFIRDQPNLSRKFVDSDNKDWRQLYWRSKEEQAERLASALEKLRQSKKQHDRQKEEKKIKILPGWQKLTPLQKLRRNYERSDYYRPVFKQQESITSANSQVALKNNLRHEPYPTVGPINSRVTSSSATSVQHHRTMNTAQTRKPVSSASIHSNKSSAHIQQNRNVNGGIIRRTLDSRSSISVTKPNSRSTLAASTKVIAKTTKSSDNSHVIKTKLDVRQQLYPKNRCDIQNAKTTTIKSSKHLKPKRVA
ncbi:2218_t:CDS:2 [Cetraspora pellucida]|uniref:2218_t:CDS:1 n=1 Tax=Cetraspora pellucida TaxID=1433469 RepID=A0A9N9ER31_9GLOM|nr:2218_t:CDS:2 [Cetraspora pellucida]